MPNQSAWRGTAVSYTHLDVYKRQVSALIGEGGEELVEQVAVGGVDFDEVEAGFEGAVRGLAKGFDDGVDAGLIESRGDGVGGGKCEGAGRDGLPAAFRGCLLYTSRCV